MGDSLGGNKSTRHEKETEIGVSGEGSGVKLSSTKRLTPLKAQVGGHSCIRQYSDSLVCKPLVSRELQFYKQLPEELYDFVPCFGGILSTYARSRSPSSTSKGKKSRKREVITEVNNIPLEGSENAVEKETITPEEILARSFKGDLGISGSAIRKRRESSCEEFMLLENLTAGYRKPCVLDLKMGTRMYTDHAAEAKRESQKRKAHESTSQRLGVRFCGSQRYSASTNSFQKLDKYIGRKCDEAELRQLLRNFFTTGGYLRRDVLVQVMQQVGDLKRRLAKLDHYRFYSSSLLIVYDGLPSYNSRLDSYDSDGDDDNSMDCDKFFSGSSSSQTRQLARIKMIDFANVTFPGFLNDTTVHSGPDAGCILGLGNLINIIDELIAEESDTHCSYP